MKNPRAYYTDGFAVGAGILRVRVLGKMQSEYNEVDRYLCEVTSPSGRGYTRGEQMEFSYGDLWDTYHTIGGLRIVSQGKLWSKNLDGLPLFHRWTNYQTMRYGYHEVTL